MGRPKKVLVRTSKPNAGMGEMSANASGGNLMVQSRSRRMIKPNPKYNSKEIIPLKRFALGDDEEEEDEGEEMDQDNTEDDEDFHDDGARDSDPEGSPEMRRRGRPRQPEAPRSEPQPMRKLQQIRAGFKETGAMSTSKLLQQSSVSLDKKRKIDFSGDEEPMGKRRQGIVPTVNVVGGRTTMTRSVGEKENAAVGKKNNSFTVINIDKLLDGKPANKNAAAGDTKTPSPAGGVTTRRTLTRESGGGGGGTTPITSTKATPSPVALGVRSTTNAVNASGKDAGGNKSMIQVRRTTPMSQTPVTTVNKVVVGSNRSPIVQQTKVGNAVASPALTRTTIRTGATPVTPRIVRTASVLNSTATTPATPVARPTVASATSLKSPLKTPIGTTIPQGAEVERLADGKSTRITTFEKRFVVRMPPENNAAAMVMATNAPLDPFICLAQLRTDIKQVKLPPRWTYQVKLMRVTKKNKDQTTVTVQRSADEGEFEVLAIEMNRLADRGAAGQPRMVNGEKKELKHDRTVVLKQKQIHITMEGRAIRLIGAPEQLATKADVETLVQIVDSLTLASGGLVEPLDVPTIVVQ